MLSRIAGYQKRRDFLVLVDSDGCAMDTMVTKHTKCFCPCLIEEWDLQPWAAEIQESWNRINMYTMTRGCNRFQALADMLAEVDATYTPVPGVEVLRNWAMNAPERSNAALTEEIRRDGHTILCKALAWSQSVNAAVGKLTMDDKIPFPRVEEGLEAAHAFADVIILSGANHDALVEEWDTYAMLENVDLVLSQDDGTKGRCIAALLEKGYPPKQVLMVGDAPGDESAARKNGVFFYPVLAGREAESWLEFPEALERLRAGSYAIYGEEKLRQFLENLQG